MEEDLRSLILHCTDGDNPPPEIDEDLTAKANDRRKKDSKMPASGVRGIVDYLDMADEYTVLSRLHHDLSTEIKQALEIIKHRLPKLVGVRNRVAHSRPMELDDPAFLIDLARESSSLDPNSWLETTQTLRRLEADPSFVLGLTMRLPKDPETGPPHNLPIPDFDETGFFGRKDEIRRIRRALNGPYPVVSIIGDGGIGKTSIALKVAYELLDDKDTGFEAIVWATAKSNMLNVNEIVRIQGAIETSLGLLGAAATELSGDPSSDPREEVLSYLENFKVLLILDNLETVLDQSLREFLRDLPLGSKVIITSRIGVGSVEWPMQLGALALGESSNFLRALGRSRNIGQILRASNPTVDSWAKSMGGHPAFMRWFVAGVQSGKRPEDLLKNNALLLDYCMSNVYSYLSPSARDLLSIMLIVQGARNQSELAFLSEASAEKLQSVLYELMNTNFVAMSDIGTDNVSETLYNLTDFARKYLSQHHGPAPERGRAIRSKREALNQLGRGLRVHDLGNSADPRRLAIRGAGDFPLVKLLKDALSKADIGQFDTAHKLCGECQALSPTYAEGWRVEGIIFSLEGNYHEASAAFENSLERDPDAATLNFHCGSWYVETAYDVERGLSLLQKAVRIDPELHEAIAEIAWAHFSLGSFQDAFTASVGLLDRAPSEFKAQGASEMAARSALAEIWRLIGIDQWDEVLECVETLEEAIDRHREKFEYTFLVDAEAVLLSHCEAAATSATGYPAQKAREYADRLRASRSAGADGREVGKVVRTTTKESGYLFVKTPRQDLFCHARDFVTEAEWTAAEVDDICVLTSVEKPNRGMRGVQVRRFV